MAAKKTAARKKAATKQKQTASRSKAPATKAKKKTTTAKKKTPAKKKTTTAKQKTPAKQKTTTAKKKTTTAKKKTTTAKKKAPAKQIPYVDYLVLGERPYLRANECKQCGARYFDRRNACANCGSTEFKKARVKNQGVVTSYTIVAMGPYVSAVVDCDGTSVLTTLVGVDPTPEAVTLGMKVKLTTYPMGKDSEGTEAVNYGFTPV